MAFSSFVVAVMRSIAVITMSAMAFMHALMQALGFFPAVLGTGRTKESKDSSGAENDRSFLHGMSEG